MRVLGIESSCDETGVALYDSEKGLLAQALYSQIDLHTAYGGVVPELASRDHVRKLLPLIRQTLNESGIALHDINGVAYTSGPGLAPLLEENPPEPPFVALLVSGGHTQLMKVNAIGDYALLGETLDDAAGEAFDKTAKLMGLPYPGGPQLAKLALKGRNGVFKFSRPMGNRPGLDFSFSGLKTQVLLAWQKSPQTEQDMADIALAFEQAVVDTLAIKCERAMQQESCKRLIVAGGVGANRYLRGQLQQRVAKLGGQVYFPRPELCTDNGAMIAAVGTWRLLRGERTSLGVGADPSMELG